MLVLSRREGESIVIGNDIVVTVLELRGGQIRLGVSAPRSYQVHREEVFNQVSAANRQAAGSPSQQRSKVANITHKPADESDTGPE